MALRNLGIDYKVVAIAEIDKFAIKSYEAIHGETNNLGDISQIKTEDIPDCDLFTYSFPCTDVSVAGKGLGLDEGSGTRSGLLWECQKVISVKKPKYLLLENVKNLIGKRHKPNFDKWLEWLESQGYTNYWQVLNAKDYGVPQNRERVFVVSILGEHEPYKFPEPMELDVRLKDILEDEVDEKYYLSDLQTSKLIFSSPALGDIKQIAHREGYRMNTRTFLPEGITGSLDTAGGGGRELHVPVKMNRNEVKGESEISQTLLARDYKGFGNQDMTGVKVIGASRGRNPNNPSDRTTGSQTEQRLEINKQGTSNTITTVQKDNYVVEPSPIGTLASGNSEKFGPGYMKNFSKTLKASSHDISVVYDDLRIRKLIPLECWRLMGFSDEDFYKAAYELREIIFKGGSESWNVKLADVTESRTHENMETFALNIIEDLKGQEEILTEWIKSLKTPENEKWQSVNVAIEKLGELAHSDSATSIIRCTDYMETLTILTEEKDPLHTVIIELGPKVSTNTVKYMKITSEESLNPLKLSIILTLIEQIIESKIFISTLHKVNICGHISITENLLSDTENQIELSLKTEAIFTRNSASQLYKQAGNSIVVNVLEGIFKNLFTN